MGGRGQVIGGHRTKPGAAGRVTVTHHFLLQCELVLHHCNIQKRTGTYKLHIRMGINIVLLGGDKDIDTRMEGGAEILIVNSSLAGLEQGFKESRQLPHHS